MVIISRHFFTPLFFFCNWILQIWNGFYTWHLSKMSLLSPLIIGSKLTFFGYRVGLEKVQGGPLVALQLVQLLQLVSLNFFPFEKTICNRGDFPDHQAIRKLTIPSTKLSNTLWHFPDHLETLQTIWKISKPSKIFQDSSETFLTILKLSISSRNISHNVRTFQTSKQLSRPSWNFSEHPKLCRTS